jgi:uncharacterized protein (DUF58 family)
MPAALQPGHRQPRIRIRWWRTDAPLQAAAPDALVLSRRRVYILPTRHGVAFAFALFVMLLGSVNYNLSLGFVLTFLLAAVGIVSMIHTYRNLAWITIAAARSEPVFAGDIARIAVRIDNPGPVARCRIALCIPGEAPDEIDVPASGRGQAAVPLRATGRGWLQPARIVVSTRYPLGLCRAWSNVAIAAGCIAYPRPEAEGPPPPCSGPAARAGTTGGSGRDDFAGVRPYLPGDPPRHIDWKADARGQGLVVKQFAGGAMAETWLDWHALPAELDTEARLSRLARWVLELDARRERYGLRLPDRSLPVGDGGTHRDRCLEALALHRPTPAAGRETAGVPPP